MKSRTALELFRLLGLMLAVDVVTIAANTWNLTTHSPIAAAIDRVAAPLCVLIAVAIIFRILAIARRSMLQ